MPELLAADHEDSGHMADYAAQSGHLVRGHRTEGIAMRASHCGHRTAAQKNSRVRDRSRGLGWVISCCDQDHRGPEGAELNNRRTAYSFIGELCILYASVAIFNCGNLQLRQS